MITTNGLSERIVKPAHALKVAVLAFPRLTRLMAIVVRLMETCYVEGNGEIAVTTLANVVTELAFVTSHLVKLDCVSNQL
jgi:hypothetical protein